MMKTSFNMMKTIVTVLVATMAMSTMSSSSNGVNAQTIVDLVAGDSDLSTLLNLVLTEAPFIADVLNTPGLWTLFAPINEAFEGVVVPDGFIPTVLLYHALSGQVLSTDLSDGLTVGTLQSPSSTITISLPSTGGVFINGVSEVVEADILATNGVIHKIGVSPLVPQVVLNNLPGPPGPVGPPTPVPLPPTPAPAPIENSVVDVAVGLVNSGNPFGTVVTLLSLAGLVTPLAQIPTVTVLAPNDEAFSVLPSQLVSDLQTPEYTLHLQDILLYHTTPTLSLSPNLLNSGVVLRPGGLFITTLNKDEDRVQYRSVDGTTLTVNDANVFVADVTAGNGVIHGIDQVLLPTSVTSTVVDRAIDTPELSTLTALLIQAELTGALGEAGPFTVFAPTNDAFLADVGADPQLDTATLTDILLYHVVPGMWPSTSIEDGLELETLSGRMITFVVDEGTGMVSIEIPTSDGDDREVPIVMDPAPTPNVPITQICQSTSPPSICGTSDILANNGVIHKIGGVLLPATDEADTEFMSSP